MDIDLSDPLGILLVVLGAVLAFKLAKTVLKLAMVVVVVAGLYLWLGTSL